MPPQLSIVLLVTRHPSLITSGKLPSYFVITSYFLLLTSYFLRLPSAASLSKSSAEVCARLHRDGARNPAKYSRRMDTSPDSMPPDGNENACTSRARGRDFSGQLARTGPSKLAPFPGAKRPREIQFGDEKPRGTARRAAARNGR